MSHDTDTAMAPLAGLDYLAHDALVVHLAGRLAPPALLALLRELRLDRTWVILDLARVPELDPATLAVLARTARRLRHHGTRLALCQLRAQPRQLIAERRFHRIVAVIEGDLHAWLSAQRLDQPTRPGRLRATRDGVPGAAMPPAAGPPPEPVRGQHDRRTP